jgi:ribosomal protein S18 acetylase RimI-like enzyme
LTSVRPCTLTDLEKLAEASHVHGQVHESHFLEQERGSSTFLVAWKSGTPVGSEVIRWNGFSDAALQPAFDRNAELCHLQVREESRGEGVGSELISAAEVMARDRGYAFLGIGVSDDNPRALSLYRRRGFCRTGVVAISEYDWVDSAGRRLHEVERNEILMKSLESEDAKPGA